MACKKSTDDLLTVNEHVTMDYLNLCLDALQNCTQMFLINSEGSEENRVSCQIDKIQELSADTAHNVYVMNNTKLGVSLTKGLVSVGCLIGSIAFPPAAVPLAATALTFSAGGLAVNTGLTLAVDNQMNKSTEFGAAELIDLSKVTFSAITFGAGDALEAVHTAVVVVKSVSTAHTIYGLSNNITNVSKSTINAVQAMFIKKSLTDEIESVRRIYWRTMSFFILKSLIQIVNIGNNKAIEQSKNVEWRINDSLMHASTTFNMMTQIENFDKSKLKPVKK